MLYVFLEKLRKISRLSSYLSNEVKGSIKILGQPCLSGAQLYFITMADIWPVGHAKKQSLGVITHDNLSELCAEKNPRSMQIPFCSDGQTPVKETQHHQQQYPIFPH